VTKLNAGEVTHRWPQVLPGSQTVLFTSDTQTSGHNHDDANIDVISLKTGERKTIQRGGFSPRYLADATGSKGTGHLISGSGSAWSVSSDRIHRRRLVVKASKRPSGDSLK
jgi:hypothetical protein